MTFIIGFEIIEEGFLWQFYGSFFSFENCHGL